MYADNLHLLTRMLPSGAALVALQTGDVRLSSNQVAHLPARHCRTHLNHLASELVPKDHGQLQTGFGPRRPIIDMVIGAADRRRLHLDE